MPAKARRQLVLHVKTRIGRQDGFLVVVAQLLIADAAVVACDAVCNRRGGVERDRVPNRLCAALPHIGERATPPCMVLRYSVTSSAAARRARANFHRGLSTKRLLHPRSIPTHHARPVQERHISQE